MFGTKAYVKSLGINPMFPLAFAGRTTLQNMDSGLLYTVYVVLAEPECRPSVLLPT